MDSINNYLKNNMKESRYLHTLGVKKMAVKLAEQYGADREKAEAAAMLHDICKSDDYPIEVLNRYVRKFDLGDKYIGNRGLSHSRVAAELIPELTGICDEEIIDAVRYHTTGRPGMSLLEKIIYIADAIEENRDYPGVEELRKIAFEDIDKACVKAMSDAIELVKSRGQFLDEESVAARDYYLK